jgi:hypothetical protein
MLMLLCRKYFNIFGELFIDELQRESSCVGEWPFTNCGSKAGYLIPFLLAVYILITNILLVNLLIAMFNDTYSSVQERSQILWNKQNYDLLLEYRSKVAQTYFLILVIFYSTYGLFDQPLAPGPLIIFNHLYLLGKQIIKAAGHVMGKKRAEIRPNYAMIAFLEKGTKQLVAFLPGICILLWISTNR